MSAHHLLVQQIERSVSTELLRQTAVKLGAYFKRKQ